MEAWNKHMQPTVSRLPNVSLLPTSLLYVPLLLIVALLGACSFTNQQPSTGVSNWDQHIYSLEQLDQWQIEGKLGYRDKNDGGSAWLNWQQKQESFNVTLNGPFGTGTTKIIGAENYAQLQRAGHEHITATSPSALTEFLFGWQWPVEQLQFWVKGIPAPDVPKQSFSHNTDGTLALLKQSNWTLKFSNYKKTGNWVLPGKIKGQNGDYHFTLVVKNWQSEEISQ
jgi:outer membrane lipoprotein LolB